MLIAQLNSCGSTAQKAWIQQKLEQFHIYEYTFPLHTYTDGYKYM